MNIEKKNYTEFCDKRKLCIAKENNKKYTLENISNKKICKIEIDKGYLKKLKISEKKCDYGFIICEDDYLILVELKGRHSITAVKQILSTISVMKNQNVFDNKKVSARIILSKTNVPNIKNNPFFLKLKKIIEKEKQGDIRFSSQTFHEKI